MDAFCILFTDTYDSTENKLNELSGMRTLASIPFGARYRLIDFMLSSLVGASVHNIGIITKKKYGSLMDHLGWGKDWDLDRKNGGLKILTPFATTDFSYNDNQFEILKSVHGYIDSMLPEYCVIASADMVANIDFNEMFDAHIKSGADLSVLCTKCQPADSDTELTLDETGKVTKAIIHTSPKDEETYVAKDVFIMEKSLLYALIDHGVSYGWKTFMPTNTKATLKLLTAPKPICRLIWICWKNLQEKKFLTPTSLFLPVQRTLFPQNTATTPMLATAMWQTAV